MTDFPTPRAHGSLSSWDDFPVHQASETIRHVATGDRNFYDRYYFNCHANNGDAFLIFGLGQYPNLAVEDAFACVVTGDVAPGGAGVAGARRPHGHLRRSPAGGGDPSAAGAAHRRASRTTRATCRST